MLVATIGLAVLGGAGIAVAEVTPLVAHGSYHAENGTSELGEHLDTSGTLVDTPVGQCIDLTSPEGDEVAWQTSVNETDRVALLSSRTCAAIAADNGPAEDDATGSSPDAVADRPDAGDSLLGPGDVVGSGKAFRSVTFSSMP